MKNKTKVRTMPKIQPKVQETPDWVFETPFPPEYTLTMYVDSEYGEEVDLTREEFIAAKHFIARLRGYDLAHPAGSTEGSCATTGSNMWTLPKDEPAVLRQA